MPNPEAEADDEENGELDDDLEETDDDDDDEQANPIYKAFEKIQEECKKSEDPFNLSNKDARDDFERTYGNYLGQTYDDEGNNLLHLLTPDAKDKIFSRYKPLVQLLIEKHPGLTATRNTSITPLGSAISKGREQLVRLICESQRNIDDALAAGKESDNCLHIAIKKNISPEYACFLIEKASVKTLCGQNKDGKTPLHLAVEYNSCTVAQKQIVEALIDRCEEALEKQTIEPAGLSPYRYHEHTRSIAKAEAKKTAAEKSRAETQRKVDSTKLATDTLPRIKERGDEKHQAQGLSTRPVELMAEIELPKGKPERRGEGRDGTGDETAVRRAETLRRPGFTEGNRRGSIALARGGQKTSRPETPVVPPVPLWEHGEKDGPKDDKRTEGKVTEHRRKAKRPKEEKQNVTPESADEIRDLLKLRYMRKKNDEECLTFLYGRNPGKEIYFNLLHDLPSLTQNRDNLEEGLKHLQFEGILRYVALPCIKFESKVVPNKLRARKPESKGRSDLVSIFNHLRNVKSVNRIIRVVVNDLIYPPHSDDAIEKALKGFQVENWDWRKYDLCIDTILEAAPSVEEVSLYWSGNNAVLRGWSGDTGLVKLKKLRLVRLNCAQGLESPTRNETNREQFEKDLKKRCPNVKVEVEDEQLLDPHEQTNESSGIASVPIGSPHKWLNCMDNFARKFQNLDLPGSAEHHEPIRVALIDDGVDINEQTLHTKIFGGMSYDVNRAGGMTIPYYVSSGGHGTLMAHLICRICPRAQLFVVKLEQSVLNGQITAESAAKAIQAAVDRKVQIISMSWTIERTPHNIAGIEKLEEAVQAAAEKGILMFCAADDQGTRDKSYPAACERTKNIFKIGAADHYGAPAGGIGDGKQVDFIFPGQIVPQPHEYDLVDKYKALTGSSIATALSAGLAAMVLYCVQIAALDTRATGGWQSQGSSTVVDKDFRDAKKHKGMEQAFNYIGSNQNGKYLEVYNLFNEAVNRASTVNDPEGRVKIVTEVAEQLCKGTRFSEKTE